MRWIVTGVAAFALLILPIHGEEDDEWHDPFEGWSQKKVKSDAKAQERKIRSKLSKWIAAKKKLAGRCSNCRGAGKRLVRRGRKMVSQPCKSCNRTGKVPHRANWRVVHWDFMSSAYRNPKNAAAIEQQVVALRRNPGPAFREQISRGGSTRSPSTETGPR